MGANTTTVKGTTIHIAFHSTHDADWDWNTEVGQWDAIVHSIQMNPPGANADVIVRDGSATGVPIAQFDTTNADDNRIKYLNRDGTGKRCRPYIKAATDCANMASGSVIIEII